MTKHRYFGNQNIFKGALDEIIIRKELVILFLGSISFAERRLIIEPNPFLVIYFRGQVNSSYAKIDPL